MDAILDTDAHVKKFQKELSVGSVALVLLAVLGAAQEPMYGYSIAKRIERGGDGLSSNKQSAIYPVLRNLHAAGLLDSHVEPSVAGPPRRYYTITDLGRAVLEAWKEAWASNRDFVDSILKDSQA